MIVTVMFKGNANKYQAREAVKAALRHVKMSPSVRRFLIRDAAKNALDAVRRFKGKLSSFKVDLELDEVALAATANEPIRNDPSTNEPPVNVPLADAAQVAA